MAKTIVFCADGTWNSPNQDDDRDGEREYTNVYKVYSALMGMPTDGVGGKKPEGEKLLRDADGRVTQIAKYIKGVGTTGSKFIDYLCGATGLGVVSRIIRGYTFISRNYEPGDDIVILGFSRGAYTARALAGMISSEGLLLGQQRSAHLSKDDAYSIATDVWSNYIARRKGQQVLDEIFESYGDVPRQNTRAHLKAGDLIEVPQIKAVGVWDTVGALGFPDIFGNGIKKDHFQFADLKLGIKIRHGFHAVSLDEQRNPFLPTLWEAPADGQVIEQVLFAGAHADVGGGYDEAGLSNIPLTWMIGKLKECGVRFDEVQFQGDVGGAAHKPWKSGLYKGKADWRTFNGQFVVEHPSIELRAKLDKVVLDPSEPPTKYQPQNRDYA